MKKIVVLMSVTLSLSAFAICGKKLDIPSSLTAGASGGKEFCKVKISDYQEVEKANESDLKKLVESYNDLVVKCKGKCATEDKVAGQKDDKSAAHCSKQRVKVKSIANTDGTLRLETASGEGNL